MTDKVFVAHYRSMLPQPDSFQTVAAPTEYEARMKLAKQLPGVEIVRVRELPTKEGK